MEGQIGRDIPGTYLKETMFKRILSYAAMYLAWLFSSGIAFYAMIKSWEAILMTYAALGLSRWGQAATSSFSIVILGSICLVSILLIEHYYRTGLYKGQLPRRILNVTLIEAVALVAIFAVNLVAASNN